MPSAPPPPTPFSFLKSFHDLSLFCALLVGVLLIGISCLHVLKPDDGLLQHRNHLVLFCGFVTAVSLAAMVFMFSPIRRTIKPGCTKEFMAALAARGFENTDRTPDIHEFAPGKKSFLTFHHERVCIYFCEGSPPLVDAPRYLLLILPRDFLT